MFAIRALERADMAEAAWVHRLSFDDRLPWLSGLHTPDEDVWFYENIVFNACRAWGAFDEGVMIGIVALRNGWVDQLYVLPDHQGRGVGSALMRLAEADDGELRLRCFQRNRRARAFYERRGFRVVDMSDGTDNEEREPDVLYARPTPRV